MSGLIEGLPDTVAIRCLARVPFYLHPKLELVSRSWQAVIHSLELFKARQEVGSLEELLCVCAYSPDNVWQMYDPLRDLWITLPVLPSKFSVLTNFGAVSTAGKLFVIGGGRAAGIDILTGIHREVCFATDEVWSYDPVVRQWGPQASMLVPRYSFACCVLNGKIVVAGGITSSGESTYQAEMYDPEKDVWIPIPDLHRAHPSDCSGVMIGGKMHVLNTDMPTVQVLDDAGAGWIVENRGWHKCPMAVVQDTVYVLNYRKGIVYKQEQDGRKVAVSAFKFGMRVGFAMIGLSDELYVIGGFLCPKLNRGIELLPDVDVLTLGNERPTWRKAAPMTLCRGPVRGCTLLRI